MRQSLLTVEAECLKTTVSEHFGDLSVFLTILSEDELALVIIVLVLSSSPVFATLSKLSSSVSVCMVPAT